MFESNASPVTTSERVYRDTSNVQPSQMLRAPGRIANLLLRRRLDAYAERVEPHSGRYILAGKAVAPDDMVFTSNDLSAGIANHPTSSWSSQIAALRRSGNGVMMSAVFVQDAENPQRILERQLAHDLGAEESILTQSGWCANVGLLQSIADETTPVYIDFFAHASLWEGIRSAGARAVGIPHNDLEQLENQIRRHGPGIITIDSIYSTTGSLAPIAGYVEVAQRHESCVLIVDEIAFAGNARSKWRGTGRLDGIERLGGFRDRQPRQGLCRSRGHHHLSSRDEGIPVFDVAPGDLQLYPAAAGHQRTHRGALRRAYRKLAPRPLARHRAQSPHCADRSGISRHKWHRADTRIRGRSGSRHDARPRHLRKPMASSGRSSVAPATASKRSLLRLTLNAGHSDEQVSKLITRLVAARQELNVDGWSSYRNTHRRQKLRGAVRAIETVGRTLQAPRHKEECRRGLQPCCAPKTSAQ